MYQATALLVYHGDLIFIKTPLVTGIKLMRDRSSALIYFVKSYKSMFFLKALSIYFFLYKLTAVDIVFSNSAFTLPFYQSIWLLHTSIALCTFAPQRMQEVYYAVTHMLRKRAAVIVLLKIMLIKLPRIGWFISL